MATSFKTVNITLNLNLEEARLILRLTQNYLGEDPLNESKEEQKLRTSIFLALRELTETYYG